MVLRAAERAALSDEKQAELLDAEASVVNKAEEEAGPLQICRVWNGHWVCNSLRSEAHRKDLEQPEPDWLYLTTDLKDCLTCLGE